MKFWDLLGEEHALDNNGKFIGDDPLQSARLDVYYNETGSRFGQRFLFTAHNLISCLQPLQDDRWVPRSVQVDLEPGVVDSIRSGPNGTLFKQDNFIYANNGAG